MRACVVVLGFIGALLGACGPVDVKCGAGTLACGSTCFAVQSDPENCGACGVACAPGVACVAGACSGACEVPRTTCAGLCVDPSSDPNHCGACGARCATGQGCYGGTCASAFYVNAARPDDHGDGLSPATAKRTIQAAIAAARAPMSILVAAGEYAGSFQAGTEVRMASGVSLFGGWDQAFTRRDPATLISRIVDTSSAGGDQVVPNRAVTVPDGVAAGTVLDGFVIQGGTGIANAGIVTLGSAAVEIRNNRIRGGVACTNYTGQIECTSIGIRIVSPASVFGNHVEATIGYRTYGVVVSDASPLVASNVVVGSTSEAGFSSMGILLVGGAPRVVGNTVDGGMGRLYSTGINGLDGSAIVDDNVVFTSAALYGRVCIDGGDLRFKPQSIRANDLFDCPQALYKRMPPRGQGPGNCGFSSANCFNLTSQVNDARLTGATVSDGNVSADPAFSDRASRDFHLTPATPAEVASGGLDHSATAPLDRDGTARTSTWSMGAYQVWTGPGCRPGLADCDGNGASVCETNVVTDPLSCGACGNACPAVAGGTAGCTAGLCGIAACQPGLGDCDADPSNGCETTLATSPAHCGACGRTCAAPHAVAACASGDCLTAGCDSGWGDCDGVWQTGCETPLDANLAHCGACGNACAAGQTCLGRTCTARTSSWSPTGSFQRMEGFVSAVRLGDGRVLASNALGNLLEIFDPGSGTWQATGSLVVPRSGIQLTVLGSGKVLVSGGNDGASAVTTAELFDPSTGRSRLTRPMTSARQAHAAVLLEDGRVLVAGGGDSPAAPQTATAEVFDPASETWDPAPDLSIGFYDGGSLRLADGRVLLAGGIGPGGGGGSYPPRKSTQVFDPRAGTWTATGPLATGHYYAAPALLPSGQVLLAGGLTWGTSWEAVAEAELFDPGTLTWSSAAPLDTSCWGHLTAVLPSGRVLVTGGTGHPYYQLLTRALLFDPGANAWIPFDPMPAPRTFPSAIPLTSGAVLVAGGSADVSYVPLTTSILFTE